jgi:hypothetical protein
MPMTVPPEIARRTWQAGEPLHALVYFVPEAQEEYAALGFDVKGNRAAGYFPARAAAMGAVTADVVQATFFNFSRLAVEFGMSGAWDIASPQALLDARYRAADRALRRLCGDLLDDPSVVEAADLARTASTGCVPYGRPLYAANAGLPWPSEPHLQLFHAQTLLREFRGDGHIAALVTEGVSGLEAAVLHVAQGDSWKRSGLQATRAYSDEEWDGAVAALVERGWLQPDGSFTDEGRAHRQRVEELTDRLSLCAYDRIGVDGCDRLRELVTPLSKAVIANGGFPLASNR